ncbi:MAG: aromatic acid exporter family protein [Candidatus Sericytochromatia bacterium]|nr:aromatic acid exporter family protein [Candidatus Sericytochromatia bacterium]
MLATGPAAGRAHLVLVSAKFGAAAGVAAWVGTRWMPEDVISVIFIALLCTRPSVTGVLRDAREQVLASLLGTGLVVASLAALGPGPGGFALAAALGWGIGTWLGCSASGLVIILFSVAYMGLPGGAPWLERAWLREASLVLGVGVALAVNLVAAPLLARVNMAVRLQGSLAEVRLLLARLAEAVAAGDRAAVQRTFDRFDGTFGALSASRQELADLSRDAALLPWWWGGASGAVSAIEELEQVVHHVQDAAGAARALLAVPPQDVEPEDPMLLETCVASLRAGVEALEAVEAGRCGVAADLGRQTVHRLRELDTRLAAPAAVDARLGPRLWVLVSLAATLGHVARAAERLAEAQQQT